MFLLLIKSTFEKRMFKPDEVVFGKKKNWPKNARNADVSQTIQKPFFYASLRLLTRIMVIF